MVLQVEPLQGCTGIERKGNIDAQVQLEFRLLVAAKL